MQIFKTSVARKVAMALSAFFLIIFLVIHLAVNFMSVLSPSTFNMLSHFMGTNPLIQFAMQPVLLVGVIFHFVMGFVFVVMSLITATMGLPTPLGCPVTWLSPGW